MIRLERTGGKTFTERKIRCRSAFSNELQVHFLALGLRDPVIQSYSFYKPWTYNGTVLPNDAGAAWWGTPRKEAKYHPAYWVGKTWIEDNKFNRQQKISALARASIFSNNPQQMVVLSTIGGLSSVLIGLFSSLNNLFSRIFFSSLLAA